MRFLHSNVVPTDEVNECWERRDASGVLFVCVPRAVHEDGNDADLLRLLVVDDMIVNHDRLVFCDGLQVRLGGTKVQGVYVEVVLG